jgi:hypothetical protein
VTGTSTKSGVLSTDANHQVIERNLGLVDITLDIRIVTDNNHPTLVVNLGSICLVELDGSLLVADNVAERLHDAAMLDRARGTTGQQRCEQEEVSRRDHNDIVVFGVELLQKSNTPPTGSCIKPASAMAQLQFLPPLHTQNHERLFGRVRLHLLLRESSLVDAVC